MTEKTTEATTEEQQKLEQKEADAGFDAGFKKGGGEEPAPAAKQGGEEAADKKAKTEESTGAEAPAETEAQKAEREAAEKAKQEAEAKAAEEKRWEGVSPAVREMLSAIQADNKRFAEETAKRMRNVEGHVGGLKSQFETSLAAAKAAAQKAGGEAPSDAEVQAALSDPQAWKRLKEDFPDWAGPVEKEFAAIRAEIKSRPAVDVDGLKKEVAGTVSTAISKGVDEAEERAFIRLKHPAWRTTVKSPEFTQWVKSQPDDVKSLAASNSGDDAVKLLDQFEEYRKKAVAAEEARRRQQRRVESAVVPEGSGAALDTGISDDEAFTRGFKSAGGK